MELDECSWEVYDDETRAILGIGLYMAGFFSVILNCWLLATFARTTLGSERNYITLLNLNIVSLLRSLLAGFLFTGVSAVAHRWMFGLSTCKLFGFLRQFIGAYQMEALLHMSIDRYVVAKYIKEGYEVTRSHYTLYIGCCWFFSACYSLPQLFNLGRYSWDFTCTACNFDFILPTDSFSRIIVIVILLLGSLKPLLMMWSMLSWTGKLEKQCFKEKEHQQELLLNQSATSITKATMFTWFPGALAICWVVLPQIMHDVIVQPPVLVTILASLCTEVASGVVVVSAFYSNTRVRSAMMSLIGEPTHTKQS